MIIKTLSFSVEHKIRFFYLIYFQAVTKNSRFKASKRSKDA